MHFAGSVTRRARGGPFNERGGPIRGLLDLAAGRYPSFLFGGGLGGFLPVFHFHEVTAAWLEPRLRFLAENGYQTVGSDAIARLVRDGIHPGPFRVALCFDDAWASLWTVAGPLLKRYGLMAIAYVIPGRVADASSCRPTLDEDPSAADGSADRSSTPLATWPELKALHDAGTVEMQSHTDSHAMIFCDDAVSGFVDRSYTAAWLARPLVSAEPVRFQDRNELGAPLFLQRSRLSDAPRFIVDERYRERALAHVADHGGPAFFDQGDWRASLARALEPMPKGRFESPDEQRRAIVDELARSRATLEDRLGSHTVRHVCFPWGVAGDLALETARATGYLTAFSNQMPGSYAVRAGDPPYRLKRLNSKHLLRLPRPGRRDGVQNRAS
ncbi:MAG TPA: polysaccharide deacetylase family protein [Vicinamibacterales bacterium]|jgi:hypothetical protein